MSVPSVYAFMDYRAYLRAWFLHRKREDGTYSHAAFARAGGCAKSALSNVISGARTPRSATLDAFARAMALTASERNYLGLLVELAAASDLAARRKVMERILATDRYRQVRNVESVDEADAMRFLQHWSVPAIRELAGLPGFRDDPGWVASALHPPISVDQAAAALESLFELGFLRRDADGTVVQEEVRFRSDAETASHAVTRFHREVLPELMSRIDTSLSDEQHLVSATVTLATALVPEAKKTLTSVLDQVANTADDPATTGPKRVYQVSIQMLPVSIVV